MLRGLKSLFKPKLGPLGARLTNTNESAVEQWVRLNQNDRDVASDALALLTMMAAGRFLKQHLSPPPSYLGRVSSEVLAYEVLRYVRSAIGEHLPETRFMVRVNSEILLRRIVERETGWNLSKTDFAEYVNQGREMAGEFLRQLEHLNGVARPEFLPLSYRPIRPDLRQRLLLLGTIAAFQQTIPGAIAEVLEEMVRVFNLEVKRDDVLEDVLRKLKQHSKGNDQ
jgi:hypothetical protein